MSAPRQVPSSNRRLQPLLQVSHSCKAGTGEVVGGATAICCCCPFGLVHVLILAIYKVPASLCRRVLMETKKKKKKKQRRRRIKEGLIPPKRGTAATTGGDESGAQIHLFDIIKSRSLVETDKELEKEMWERFYNTGFWRSHSQRHSPSTQINTSVSNL